MLRSLAVLTLAAAVVSLPAASSTLSPAAASGQPAAADRPAACAHPTIVGTDGDDTLVGTPGADVIWGGRGNDVLRGLGGDDVLCGGPGSDRLVGGQGDDTLLGGWDHRSVNGRIGVLFKGDTLDGGPGDDLLDGGSDPRISPSLLKVAAEMTEYETLDYSHAVRGLHVDLVAGTAHGQGHDTIRPDHYKVTGSRWDDWVRGTDASEAFDTGAGDDVVYGGGAEDWIHPDLPVGAVPDHDVVYGGAGPDLIEATEGADVLFGGPGDDEITDWGSVGADLIHGGRGRDDVQQTISARRGEAAYGGPGSGDSLYNQTSRTHRYPQARMVCGGFEDMSLAGTWC